MRPRIYIDTSVIGGYYDEEFEESTKKFFERIENRF
jgi:predicted nucleic acid-binding protein